MMASPLALAKKQAAETARLAEAVTNTAEATGEVVGSLSEMNERLERIEAMLTSLVAPEAEPEPEPESAPAPASKRATAKASK